MEIGMTIIFLALDLLVTGITWGVTSQKDSYEKGMLLGVHIPEEAVTRSEVEEILRKKQRDNRRFQFANLLAGTGVCLLNLAGIGIFLIFWVLWLLEYVLGLFCLICGAHRKLYRLKKEMGWGEGSADGDEYWKHGWYFNPEDKRLLVEDRKNSTGYAFNMARPASRLFVAGCFLVMALLPLSVGICFYQADHVPISVSLEGNRVTIESFLYRCEFTLEQIEEAVLLPELPEDSFDRTNGASTFKRELGHYRGEETGPCMMFIDKGYSPVLFIDLGDESVFVNSREAEQTKEWYEMLARSISGADTEIL